MPKKNRKREIQYALYREFLENPRVTTRNLFRIISALCNWKIIHWSAQTIVDNSFTDKVLVGPYLYCNPGIWVTLYRREERTQAEKKMNEHSTILGIQLMGFYSYVVFSRDRVSNLCYAEVTKPSFPEKVSLEHSVTEAEREFLAEVDTPEKLGKDPIPCWDERDWKVYYAMKNPRRPFFEAAQDIQVPWKMVRERFRRIIKDCKVSMGFFPLGYTGYNHMVVTFKTDYETWMRDWLCGIDRSLYLFKVDDILVVYLLTSNVNVACLKFSEMEQIGIIRNFRVAVSVNSDGNPLII